MSPFQTTIKDLSPQGLGVANHPDGRIFFIAGTCPGDEVVAEIQSYKKNYGFAVLKKIITPSSFRVSAPCVHHGIGSGFCSGCPWMFIDYSAQLQFKQKLVETQLRRAQVLADSTLLLPIIGSEKILGYRNRAQFKSDGRTFGYVEAGTNKMVDIQSCLVLTEKNQKKLLDLRSQLPKEEWHPKSTGDFKWNLFELDDTSNEGFRFNKRFPFRQGNDSQNLIMKNWLKNKISANKNSGTVLELFCGSGNFTEVLKDFEFDKIVAVEVVGESLDILKNKKWPNVTIVEANLFNNKSGQQILKVAAHAETLVLDPPRDGFANIDEFLKPYKNMKDIYFISCEITNFAKDAKKLIALGYHLKEVQPLDQFPHTPYVEVLAHFSNRLS